MKYTSKDNLKKTAQALKGYTDKKVSEVKQPNTYWITIE